MKFKIVIPDNVTFILDRLHSAGYEAFIVGGCVRDSMLGKIPNDWDITTSAKPDAILEVFKDRQIIETGLQHGTVTVMVNGIGYEVTTYRIDGNYSDNRRPDSVQFTTSLIEDLKRRDFTINAMAYNEEVGLVDPFGGEDDLGERIIRCVGSAEERFKEDALRIMRAFRFSAQLGFNINDNTLAAALKLKENLLNISQERITAELCKGLQGLYPQIMMSKEVLCQIIPEFKDTIDFDQRNKYHVHDVWEHTTVALYYEMSGELIIRLAALFHDIGKPHSYQEEENGTRHFKGHGKVSAEMTDKIMRRMRFSNYIRESVVELVFYHDATIEEGEKYVKRWLGKIGETQFRRLLELKKADINAHNPQYSPINMGKVKRVENILKKVLSEQQCFTLKDLAVNGDDLITVGYKQGKEIGNTLKQLLEAVIEGAIANEKEVLLEAAKHIYIVENVLPKYIGV